MSILLIGQKEEQLIAAAVEKARKKVLPLSIIRGIATTDDTDELLLKDRKPGVEFVRMRYKPEHIMLGTYRCSFSFEEQPDGIMRHLSISSARRGFIPGMEVLKVVLPLFGFSGIPATRPGRMWNEEFEPNWFAVNIVELDA